LTLPRRGLECVPLIDEISLIDGRTPPANRLPPSSPTTSDPSTPVRWSGEDHDTGFHDHDLSSGAVVVAQGSVVEERLRLGGAPEVRRYVPGDVFDFSPMDIHRVVHAGGTPATTLHAYSPPLRRMGAYLVEPSGTLQRHPMAKDQELRPLTSAA